MIKHKDVSCLLRQGNMLTPCSKSLIIYNALYSLPGVISLAVLFNPLVFLREVGVEPTHLLLSMIDNFTNRLAFPIRD